MSRRFFRYSFLKLLCIGGLFWTIFIFYMSNQKFFNVSNQKYDVDVDQFVREKISEVIEKDLIKDYENQIAIKEIDSTEKDNNGNIEDFETNENSEGFFNVEPKPLKAFLLEKPVLSDEILKLHWRLNLTNPGHLGQPVFLSENIDSDIERMLNQSKETYKINEFVSSLIPLDRDLPDIRTDYCKQKNYSQNLPVASVIMVFHNEALSMILRSVYSVLNRSPDHLIGEVILIDDCSTLG